MAAGQTLETDWEFDVARADNVLDLEVWKVVSQSIIPGGEKVLTDL